MVPCRIGSALHRKLRDLRADRELLGAPAARLRCRRSGDSVIGAGTIINPIIKIVTTVVILGAVYLFFVKPILDTTEDVAGRTAGQIAQSQSAADQRSQDIALNNAQSRADSYANSLQNTWPAAAREVKSCVREAKADVKGMERCAEYGQTIVHSLQSDRNFALAYANSLSTQGRSGDAAEVRDCVRKAGYKVGPMQRCRDLADKLLFG